MNLREQIEQKIAENPNNPEQAAFEVCKMLDLLLSLSGNGWFDDDPDYEKWCEEQRNK